MEDSEAEMSLIQYLRDYRINSHLQQSRLLALHFLPNLFLHCLAQLGTGHRGGAMRSLAERTSMV